MRKDNPVSSAFAKNEEFERYLSVLNNTLSDAQADLIQDLPEVFPTLHILGAPRSGTTLITQMLSSFLDVGYINNLIAAFWKAPLFGIQLSKRLLGTDHQSDFSSQFGRTKGINEPHEFGYFWNYYLSYPDFQQKTAEQININWNRLTALLTNMTYGFQKPIVFKSFLVGFHALHLYQHLPKSCFLYVKRDFVENAYSILQLRKKMLGSEHLWASIKPRQFEWLHDKDVFIQIAGQILFLEHEYLAQLKQIPNANVLVYPYEAACVDPGHFITAVQKCLQHQNPNCAATLKQVSVFHPNKSDIPPELATAFNQAKEAILEQHNYLLHA